MDDNRPLVSPIEIFARISFLLDQVAPMAEPGAASQYLWLDRLRRGLTSVVKVGRSKGLGAANWESKLQFSILSSVRSVDERVRLKKGARIGGRVRSKRKTAACRKNGKLGGRPVPDKKTLTLAVLLLDTLQRRDKDAWTLTANYLYAARVLRALAQLMKSRGVTNADLLLPQEWDPSKKSQDPHFRFARFARSQGFFYDWHSPREFPKSTP